MEKLKIPFEIADILFRQLKHDLNREEEIRLQNWLEKDPSNSSLYHRIKEEGYIRKKLKRYEDYDKKTAWLNIIRQIDQPVSTRRMVLRKLIPYAAAILILAAIGGYLFFNHLLFDTKNQVVKTGIIVPGTQKAILTLGNGEKIALNNTMEEVVIPEQQVDIVDANNTLTYLEKEPEKKEKTIVYNTLETPRGGEYHVVLSDGTRIWLNAVSKLRYPTEFSGDVRYVEIEGEAYFEVAENRRKPFIVNTGKMEIVVLGTSFNVMAYCDEENIETTLIEGSVKVNIVNEVNSDLNAIEITPGQQAVFVKEQNILEQKKVNTEVFTAWMDGKFIIDHESLEGLMRRLGRWYDFETEYTDPEIRNYHFSGTIKRYDNISSILEMIALTTHISFEIKNNTVIATKKDK